MPVNYFEDHFTVQLILQITHYFARLFLIIIILIIYYHQFHLIIAFQDFLYLTYFLHTILLIYYVDLLKVCIHH